MMIELYNVYAEPQEIAAKLEEKIAVKSKGKNPRQKIGKSLQIAVKLEEKRKLLLCSNVSSV